MIALAQPTEGKLRLRRAIHGGQDDAPGFACLPGTGQAAALAHDDGIDLLVTGVGGGKSLVAAIKFLAWVQRHPRRANGLPSEWFVLSFDLKNVVNAVFKKLREAESFFGPPGTVIERILPGLADPRVIFRCGAIAYGRSAGHGVDPESFKGYEVDGVWADEASKLRELAVIGAIARCRNADAIRVVITTNPKPGWVWRLYKGVVPDPTGDREADKAIAAYRRILEHVQVRAHRWDTRSNTTNRGSVLDGLAAIMDAASPDLSRQEIDGLFLGTEIASEHFPGMAAAFGGEAQGGPAAVVGVDLGQTRDWTWLVAMTSDGVVVDIERFQGSTADVSSELFYPWAAERLLDFAARNGAKTVKMDEALQGRAFAQMLRANPRCRQLGLRIEGYGTDSPRRKATAFEALGVAFGRGAVRVPDVVVTRGARRELRHVRELQRELAEMTVTDLPSGGRRWDHPSGGHDDGAIALALAWLEVADKPRAKSRNLGAWMRQPGLS